jgi:rhamnose utilization protein RhaD (predicted bifunctional aldolase and dehydrogenase)
MLNDLIELTRTLGKPDNEYVIIGEGNTSCRVEEDVFWIKASGQGMDNIGDGGFVALHLAQVLALLAQGGGSDMSAAKVQPDTPLKPSIEATFHALLLADCGVTFIGHTHPVAVNKILCSSRAEQFAQHRLFPDEVVLCGPRSVFVPYTDPGLPLAYAIRDNVRAYMEAEGEAPKVILLANHGLIALGQTAREVLNVTAMCVKAAHIFTGACAIGEPVFMSESDITHIYKRPDEIYRRKQFVHKDY